MICQGNQEEITADSVFSTLHPTLQQLLIQRLGWTELREVQEKACQAIGLGGDVLVIAPTAGGKTEAALIPVMDRVLRQGAAGVFCLYLSPLKALINDQGERFSAFCLPAGLSVKKWHGDVPRGDRAWAEGEPPEFLMITPESLEVLLCEPGMAADLSRLQVIIVDEVHAFVETERGVQLRALLDQLDRTAGRTVQRIGLSATVGNPQDVLSWLGGGRNRGSVIQIPVPARERRFSFTRETDLKGRADAVARIVKGRKAIVFVGSRSDAEELMRALADRVRNLAVHHSALSPDMRSAAESAFNGPESACIISTSTLELGIDIGSLDVVVQFGPPGSVSSLLQRMGRTGRRGGPPYLAGIAADSCGMLCTFAAIEAARRGEVEGLKPPGRPYNVLVQQLLLTLIRERRSSRKKLRAGLLSLSPFRGIDPSRLELLFNHLLGEGYIESDGDLLMPGWKLESTFGRSNWKDLYSVIAGGDEFRAVTPDGEVVGCLDARFVGARDAATFLLGGKSWTMVKSDDSHQRVVVIPGGEVSSRAFWRGGGIGLSPLICKGVARILSSRRSSLPLLPADQEIAAEVADSLPFEVDGESIQFWERDKGEITLLTWRGRQFNRILFSIVTGRCGGKVRGTFGDFGITLKGPKRLNLADQAGKAIKSVQGLTPAEAGSELRPPSREFWKFGSLLPETLFLEMVWSDYYHIEEFIAELRRIETITSLAGGPETIETGCT